MVPYFQDIHINNVICRGAKIGIQASGTLGIDNEQPEVRVKDIDIQNTTIVYHGTDKQIDDATAKLTLTNVNLVSANKQQ
jgi:hypothetical protein